jgi:hypothetical protein
MGAAVGWLDPPEDGTVPNERAHGFVSPYRLFWLLMAAMVLLIAGTGITLAVAGPLAGFVPEWLGWGLRGLFFLSVIGVLLVACPRCHQRMASHLRAYGFPPERGCAACGYNLNTPYGSATEK